MRSLTSFCNCSLRRRLSIAAGSFTLAWLAAEPVSVLAQVPRNNSVLTFASSGQAPAALESASASDQQAKPPAIVITGHQQPIAQSAPANDAWRNYTPPTSSLATQNSTHAAQNPLRGALGTQQAVAGSFASTAQNAWSAAPTTQAGSKTNFASTPRMAARPSHAIASQSARRHAPVAAAAPQLAMTTSQPPEAIEAPIVGPEVAGPPLRPIPLPGDNLPPGFPYDGAAAGCGSCGPQWYVQGDALYFERNQSERRVITQNLGFGDFDFEFGGRITFGRQFDCLEGVEVAITQLGEWDAREEIVSPAGGLNSRFVSPFFGAGAISGFTNAVRQDIRYESQLNGFEVNRRQFGWDVVSSMWGFRYINLDEEFALLSTDLGGGGGAYAINSDNHLVGLQIGGDMAQPIVENLWIRGKGKLGGFANFSDHDSVFINTGGPTIRASDDEISFSFLSEVGVGANLQLTPGVALRLGYEMWYIWGLALAPEQIDFTVGPQMGAFHDDNGDIFIHGPTAGMNIVW
jgi:hypothetical protein